MQCCYGGDLCKMESSLSCREQTGSDTGGALRWCTVLDKGCCMQVAGEASLEVELAARNAVTDISVCEDSLPAQGLAAGNSTVICAQVTPHTPSACESRTDSHV